MQNIIRNTLLSHLRLGNHTWQRKMCASSKSNDSSKMLLDRVVGLVKKFDRIDAKMVTETADFQKDLSLDSLDRVELVMAFEEEFAMEIPEEEADKLTCCADVAKYIASGDKGKITEDSL
ncbi:Acyl carrier protein [Thalictrum thalictroides]|uniref:Acyl carrier protein n=1 Tax=Thalictrum thalictroides TaxID=46969 RepID=A0A7J6WI27_THATH|nr:Acyl carrier protein [Thalictrum thalictroides]